MGNIKYTTDLFDRHDPHEETWPKSDGEGGAGAVITLTCDSNNNTDAVSQDQYYWGEPLVIVAPSAIALPWHFVGINMFGVTTALSLQIQLFRVNYQMSDVMKIGDDDWDEGKLDPEVENDGTMFATGDKVWIYSDAHTAGEILDVDSVTANVVTVSREAVTGGTPNGMRWNHSIDGASERMYRCYRDRISEHEILSNYSAASIKDFQRHIYRHGREFNANDGLIGRILNLTNGNAASLDVSIIYDFL